MAHNAIENRNSWSPTIHEYKNNADAAAAILRRWNKNYARASNSGRTRSACYAFFFRAQPGNYSYESVCMHNGITSKKKKEEVAPLLWVAAAARSGYNTPTVNLMLSLFFLSFFLLECLLGRSTHTISDRYFTPVAATALILLGTNHCPLLANSRVTTHKLVYTLA